MRNKSTLQESNIIRINLISTGERCPHKFRRTFRMILIGILAILLVVTAISSQSYVKKASALFGSGPCPAGKVRNWAGICFNKSEAKACLTCAPGSAAPKSTASEKPEALARVETNKEVEKPTAAEKPIAAPAEKPKSGAPEKHETLAGNSGYEANDLFPNKSTAAEKPANEAELGIKELPTHTHCQKYPEIGGVCGRHEHCLTTVAPSPEHSPAYKIGAEKGLADAKAGVNPRKGLADVCGEPSHGAELEQYVNCAKGYNDAFKKAEKPIP